MIIAGGTLAIAGVACVQRSRICNRKNTG